MDLTCDTRIAITAVKGSTTELWDLRWNGTVWLPAPNTTLGAPLAWVAPAPGTVEPRLAGSMADAVIVGDERIPIPAGQTITSITGVSFDRDQRDTVAVGHSDSSSAGTDLFTLPAGTQRSSDIAGVYLFLASEDARSLTGQSLVASYGEVMA